MDLGNEPNNGKKPKAKRTAEIMTHYLALAVANNAQRTPRQWRNWAKAKGYPFAFVAKWLDANLPGWRTQGPVAGDELRVQPFKDLGVPRWWRRSVEAQGVCATCHAPGVLLGDTWFHSELLATTHSFKPQTGATVPVSPRETE